MSDALHELNRRVIADPENTLPITQQFYDEKVKAGDTDGANETLLVRSMIMARDNQIKLVPQWFSAAGLLCGGLTLFFLMGLIVASIARYQVPQESKGLVSLFFALGLGLSTAFLGGDAAAKGKIPLSDKYSPIQFSATGGIAVVIIVLLLMHFLYK